MEMLRHSALQYQRNSRPVCFFGGNSSMKKFLLKCNLILYAFQYSLSLFHIGFDWGLRWSHTRESIEGQIPLYPLWHVPYIQMLFFSLAYLILLIIGFFQYRQREYRKVWSYALLALASLGLGWLHCSDLQRLDMHAGIVLILISTVVIAVFHCICAILTWRENKNLTYWK